MNNFKQKLLVVIGTITTILIFSIANAADPAKGKKVFRKCVACHSLQECKNKIGPPLNNLLGRKAGSVEGYKYSKAMATHGKLWSFEEMNGFLIKPKDWIKGTKMTFVGLKKETERAAVILYMNNNTDSPLPLK